MLASGPIVTSSPIATPSWMRTWSRMSQERPTIVPSTTELRPRYVPASITLRDTQTGEERDLPVTGLFIAIGHDPRSELLTGQVDLDDDGYVLVDHPSTKTNLPGVFAAGDLVDHHYRQAITAAGTGCAAALDAERFIAALDHEASTAGDAAATVQAIEEQVQTAGA